MATSFLTRSPRLLLTFRARTWSRILILGYLAIYLASVILLHVIERYRMPVLALLFIFSGVFIEELRAALRRRQFRHVTAGLAAFMLAAVFINIPLIGPYLANIEAHWTQVNLGTACVGLGRLPEAELHFRRAHELAPHRLEPLNQLVNLKEKQQEPATACAWHDRLLTRLRTRYTHHESVLADELARHVHLTLAARRPAEAAAAARELTTLIPREAQAHYFLAVALRAAGDPSAARAALDQTLALDPRHAEALSMKSALEKLEDTSSK